MGNLCGMMAGEDKKGIALLREVGMEEDNAPPVAKYLKEGGDPDLCVEYELMPESPIRRMKPRLIKMVCRGDKDNTFQALAMVLKAGASIVYDVPVLASGKKGEESTPMDDVCIDGVPRVTGYMLLCCAVPSSMVQDPAKLMRKHNSPYGPKKQPEIYKPVYEAVANLSPDQKKLILDAMTNASGLGDVAEFSKLDKKLLARVLHGRMADPFYDEGLGQQKRPDEFCTIDDALAFVKAAAAADNLAPTGNNTV